MVVLRPYQEVAVAALRQSVARRYRAPLLVSPTGSGKTVVFCYLTWKLVGAGKRVVILNHRDELTDQISRSLHNVGVIHGVIAAGMQYDPRPLAHVASVFTLARRLDRVQVPDYVIIDEAHHCIAGSTWEKVIAHWKSLNPALIIIGVTATPERLSGEGLSPPFDDIVLGPAPGPLIADGWLSPYRLFAPAKAVDFSNVHHRGGDLVADEAAEVMSKRAIIGDVLGHYRKYLNGAPAVAFCASIKHSNLMADAFRAEGWRAASIDGKMEKTERRGVVKSFADGQLHVMTSCNLISEGFDVPGIVGALLLRPTESLALYLQQVGRALRPAPGKEAAIILDHVGNSTLHGLPDDDREWTLDGCKRSKAKRDPDDIVIRQCKRCYAVSRATATSCRECGFVFAVKSRMVEQKEGELTEVDPEVARIEFARARSAANDLAGLIEVGRMKKMKNPEGWAKHVLQAREEKAKRRAAS